MKQLVAVWEGLTPEQKKQVKGTSSKKGSATQAVQAQDSELSLPTEIIQQLLIWGAEPCTFLKSDGNSQPKGNYVLTQIYELLCELETADLLNQIRRRILLLTLIGLRRKLPRAYVSKLINGRNLSSILFNRGC